MAEDEDEPDYESIELQEQDDDCDNIYANVETKTTAPTAQDNDSQKIQQSGIRCNRPVGVGVGLLCAVLALISIGVPLYLNQSNMVEREQLLARNNNLTEERDQLQTGFDQMMTSHNNLAAQNDHLQTRFDQMMTRYNQLTAQKDQLLTRFDLLKTSHNNLTKERDDMKMRLCETPGWQKLGRGCYYVSTEKKNWEESRKWCGDTQSYLIVINSKEEQDFVANFNKRVWLGLTDRDREGSFQWVDRTTLTSPTYWMPGQPNNVKPEDDCVEFYDGSHADTPDRGWNDISCSDHYIYWICERVLC